MNTDTVPARGSGEIRALEGEPSNVPLRRLSLTAARVSLGATLAFVALVALLHLLEAEIDPSWRFISEYALGSYGWMMSLAFFSLALAYVALVAALRTELRTIGGRVGLGLMVVSALGLILAGVFTTDPITASAAEATTIGALHQLGGTLGMAMPFAAGIVGWKLARHGAWSPLRRSIAAASAIAILGFLVALVWLGVVLSGSGGAFGPSVHVGWPNRLEVLGYCVWLVVLARAATRVGGVRSEDGAAQLG